MRPKVHTFEPGCMQQMRSLESSADHMPPVHSQAFHLCSRGHGHMDLLYCLQMDLLKTRRAVVTGAQRGIGRAIAEAYEGQAAALVLRAKSSFENDLNQVMLSGVLQPVGT
jgi:hypothetical protein